MKMVSRLEAVPIVKILADSSPAENHPSTEYPDEEVQSDDEYGVNPYQYRNGNASDNEEYDEDDARFSDDELEASKEPWSRRPWLQAYSGKNEGNDEEEGLY